MSRERRDAALEEYREMHRLWRSRGDPERGITGPEAKELRDEARVEYFEALPRVTMSRCPFCGQALVSQFDPWGFDGFWWQERELGLARDPEGCEHFRVLTGAVRLQEDEVRGGEHEAHLGPGVPYVIPAVLELPGMTVVVSELEMETGDTAWPLPYFSTERPPPGSLTASWRRTRYGFRTADGRPAWTVKKDPWDFDLRPWVEAGDLMWIEPGDPDWRVVDGDPDACPYVGLTGHRGRQVVKGDRVWFKSPPNPEDEPDPFGP